MDSFKNKFGQVFSPNDLIIKMIDLIPEKFWNCSLTKWLDPGSGEGQFALQIINKLQDNLSLQIPCKREREKHIIQNMVHMIEINPINVNNTINNFSQFSHQPNIICDNFIDYTYTDISFDVIIGNPPFNFNGLRKVPTNTQKNKKNDGSTIWIDFIKKSLSLLKNNGFLCFITPSIWLRPDKQKIYHLLNQYQIHHIYCMTNTETNKLFKGAAQTPTVIFTLQKCPKFKETLIFDNNTLSFVKYNIQNNIPIPVFGVSIINKLLLFTNKYGSINKYVIKTNPLPKNTIVVDYETPYQNISTCIIKDGKPSLVINYTNQPAPFFNCPKLVMAHKMYGFPFIDQQGLYGISSRDNYIFLSEDITILNKLFQFFSTHFAIYLFETTRYRMKYLEKSVFEFIPDIFSIPNFPRVFDEDNLFSLFNINDYEKKYILSLHKKKYSFFKKN